MDGPSGHVLSLHAQHCEEQKSVFWESCNEGRGEVRGELVIPPICSVLPFVKNVANSVDFDSYQCVSEKLGIPLCFPSKVQAHK